MPHNESQPIESAGVSRPEMDRAWQAIERLTQMHMEEAQSNAELKAGVQSLLKKMDDMVANGSPRCADHNARVERMEDNIKMLDSGTHPACVAQYRKLQLWVYASFGTGVTALIGAAAELIKYIK